MKINTLITAIFFVTIIFFIAAINPSSAATNANPNCETYPDKINQLQQLNTRGGSAKQQAQRREKINRYETALSKCRSNQTIAVAYGPQKTTRNTQKKIKVSTSQPPQLQQLIKTCNYWVEQTKLHPSWHNSNFRDTACRAADDSKKMMYNTNAKAAPNVRKLSDCIKPNNVIDDQVNECIKGARTASPKNVQ